MSCTRIPQACRKHTMLTGRRVLFGCMSFLAPKAQGMVSGHNMPLRVPHKSATASALRRCALRCRTSPRRRWLGAVALVMWNMRKRHFSHSCKTAAAHAHVSALGCRFQHRSFGFNTLTPQQPKVTLPVTANRAFSPLAACFQHVYLRKPVNVPFFAPADCKPLMPLWFPHGYRR